MANLGETYDYDEAENRFSKDLISENIPAEIIGAISAENAIRHNIIPLKYDEDGVLVLVTNSPRTIKYIKTISNELGIECRLLTEEEGSENVRNALGKYYGYEGTHRGNVFAGVRETDSDSSPLKRRVETMLMDGVEAGASDIHILPYSDGIYVHFRVNGRLENLSEKYNFEANEGLAVTNIIKGMDTSGNADASKVNVPNNGAFTVRHGEIQVNVRIATTPVGSESSAQKTVLRLLPQQKTRKELSEMGYTNRDLRVIKNTLFKNATGLFINSGPTGSGKTTSLYAQMDYVYRTAEEKLNVITIEDPIEIRDERFTQIQVRDAEQENLRMTARDILKASLRSDPDMILYGEIRDKEDAIVAVEASTTGHKVFTTVHASNCIKTITRLLDLEVSKMSLLSELRMIISQRLIGYLCPFCSQMHELTTEEKEILTKRELGMILENNVMLMEIGEERKRAQCPHCNGKGIVGRTAVAEYVVFDTELRDALYNQQSFREVTTILQDRNFKTMWDKGLFMAMNGWVEFKEVIQTIGRDS